MFVAGVVVSFGALRFGNVERCAEWWSRGPVVSGLQREGSHEDFLGGVRRTGSEQAPSNTSPGPDRSGMQICPRTSAVRGLWRIGRLQCGFNRTPQGIICVFHLAFNLGKKGQGPSAFFVFLT